ncbi:MAG: endoflagellar motor protein [Leptospiraceae bacterium]|nr:endoflagellar motor protein [Leptospiraceae bacterium]MCK6381163.1 endoflagellar motor protein [Leptospiraceae bacterium]NUM41992.1 endoflagellar motor protein [Leptospiraceae bacterium]
MPTNKKLRFRQKPPSEDSEKNERWLLTYADMITLLLGLFIVMYSISTVDQEKLKTVARQIRGGFGLEGIGESLIFDGGTDITEEEIFLPKSKIFRLWERLGFSLKRLKNESKVLFGLDNNEEIKLTVFASSLGEGNLKFDKDTDFTFQRLSEMSKNMEIDIILRVQIPYLENIEKKGYANNWDFNAHRASLLADFLELKYGIPKNQISIQAYSEFRKMKTDNPSPEEYAKQERIEIIIRKKEN